MAEKLERRDLLAAGTNRLILDFTPDLIEDELAPDPFVASFVSTGLRGDLEPETYQFLDFSGDGTINGFDAFLAAEEIGNQVRQRLGTFRDHGDVDLRVHSLIENLAAPADALDGMGYLEEGWDDDELNVFVIYLGGHLEDTDVPPLYKTYLGVAEQGFVDENHEFYGYAFTEKIATSVANASSHETTIVSESTTSDQQSATTRLIANPDQQGALNRVKIVSGNSDFSHVQPGDEIKIDYVAFANKPKYRSDQEALYTVANVVDAQTIDLTYEVGSVDDSNSQIPEQIIEQWSGAGNSLNTNVVGTRLKPQETLQREFVDKVAWTVLHEFGHLLGLGHITTTVIGLGNNVEVRDNPRPASSVMNYRVDPALAHFPNEPSPYETELAERPFLFFDPEGEPIENVNHYQEVYQSIRFDESSGKFTQESYSNIYGETTLENIHSHAAHGLVGDPEGADDFFTETVFRDALPAASTGVLGTTTPAEVAATLEDEFNTFRAQGIEDVAGLFDFSANGLPLIPSELNELLGLAPALRSQLSAMDLAAAVSMTELVSTLESDDFQVDFALTDAEFAALDPALPADFLRASFQVDLASVVAAAELSDDVLSSIAALNGLTLEGMLNATADAVLSLSFGIDTGGFYLLPGELIRLRGDADAEIQSAAHGVDVIAGTADLSLYATVDLTAIASDGRIRLADLTDSLSSVAGADLGGNAAVGLTFHVPLPGTDPISLEGDWLWKFTESGVDFLTEPSGFDTEGLMMSLTSFAGQAIDAAGESVFGNQSHSVSGQLGAVPLIGDSIAGTLGDVFAGDFATQNTFGNIDDFFEQKGISSVSVVDSSVLADHLINGTALSGELIELHYVEQKSPTFSYEASGTESLGPVDVTLTGNVNGDTSKSIDVAFGYDFEKGAYIVEGSTLSINFALGGNVEGTASAAGLASITATANGVFNVLAGVEINDGDSLVEEKLYLNGPNGTRLETAIAREESYSLSGNVSLNELKLTGKIHLLPADFPTVTICGDAQWDDLNAPTGTFNLDPESVLESLFQVGDHSLNNIRRYLGDLADKIVSEIPFIGPQLTELLPADLNQGLTFDPTGTSPFEDRLNAVGLSIVSVIDGMDLLAGDFTSTSDLVVLNFSDSIAHALPQTTFSVEEKNFGIGSFQFGGSFGGTANLHYDITFGYNVNEGFFIGHQSDEDGSHVGLTLNANANLLGDESKLTVLSPIPNQPDWFTATAEGSVNLMNHQTSFPLADPKERTYVSLFNRNNSEVTYTPGSVTADLKLSVDYADLPVIGPFLGLIPAFQSGPLTWSVEIGQDVFNRQADWSVILDVEGPAGDVDFDAAFDLLNDNKEGVLSALVSHVLAEMVREEDQEAHPIPNEIREVLSEGIEFLGMIDENLPPEDRHRNLFQSITGVDIAGNNHFPTQMLDALNVLLAPDEVLEDESERASLANDLIGAHDASGSGEGVSVHYDFTELSNLTRLLKGESADLFRVSFSDPETLNIGTAYTVVPDQTVLSLWGAVNVDLSATITPNISASYAVDIGVGTDGLFIDPSSSNPLFSFTGSLPVNLNADLKVSPLNFYNLLSLAEGTLAFGVELTGNVQLTDRVYPFNKGVDLDELLSNEIVIDATLDLYGKVGLENETVGLDLELVEYEGDEPDFTFPLYKGSAGVGKFESFKDEFLKESKDLRECAHILSRSENSLSAPAGLAWCLGDFFGNDIKEEIEEGGEPNPLVLLPPEFFENPREYVFNGLEQQGKNLQGLGDKIGEFSSSFMNRIGTLIENGIDFLENNPLITSVGGAIDSATETVNNFLKEGGRAGTQMLEDLGTFATNVASWVPDTSANVDFITPQEAVDKLTSVGFGLVGEGDDDLAGWVPVNQLPHRWTYSWVLEPHEFGKKLVIDWNESDAAYWINEPNVNIVIGATRGENPNDPVQLFIDAPDFDRYETIATHPDYQPFRKPITHQNMAVFPLADIREIHILGTEYNDRIIVLPAGEQGDVKLEAVSASLIAAGFGGDDFIVGGPVEDRLYGFSGRDTIIGGSGADEIWGGNGIDHLQGQDGPDTIRGGAHPDHIQGQGGSDHLYGYSDLSDGTGVENPNDGNDLIDGGDGDDVLWGGVSGPGYGAIITQDDEGNFKVGPAIEILIGGEGEDKLYGGSGPDELFGDFGKDTLDGGSGNDRLIGGRDADHLIGGDDNDLIFGDFTNATKNELYDDLFGGDYVDGGYGNDTIFGGPGEDKLNGGGGADHIEGQKGNDYLGGGVLGINEVGEVVNHFIFLDANDFLKGGEGNDVIWGGASGAGLDRVAGTTRDMDYLLGEEGHDTIRGGLGPDFINGGTGDDFLFGDNGDDILESESGAARLEGGDGNDYLIGSADVDRGLGSYLIGGDPLSSFDDDTLIGGNGPDTLDGGNGNDVLAGAFGSDSLIGGSGRDEIYTGFDQFGTGDFDDVDIVYSYLPTPHDAPTDPANHADTVYGSAGKDIITTSVGDDVIVGFHSADEIDAGEGDNTIDAGEGDDLIVTGSGDDTITAGFGSDVIEAGWGADLIHTGFDEAGAGLITDVDIVDADPRTLSPFPGVELDHGDTVFGSLGADTVFLGLGNNVAVTFGGADSITAENGSDSIDAGSGNDTVVASDGDDTLTGGAGSDVIEAGWGADLIHTGVDQLGGGLATDVDVVDGDPKMLTPFPGTLLDHSDTIFGSEGTDHVLAGHGNNVVTTFGGDDTVTAQAGDDIIYSGDHDDVIDAGEGNNYVDAGADQDSIIAGGGDDTLLAGAGDDTLWASDGDDEITAGAGSDLVHAGWGADVILTGQDALGGGEASDLDVVHADPETFAVIPPHPLSHSDVIVGSIGSDTVFAGPGDDVVSTLDGSDFVEGDSGAEDIDLGAGSDIGYAHTIDRANDDRANDTIVGGDGNDQIWGGQGDDSLSGGSGSDRIAGEWGDDRVEGDGGNDLILAGHGNDHVDGGDGDDHIEAGHGNDTVLGGLGDDTVLGEQGDDSVMGGGDDDDLRGGQGIDEIHGEAGDDHIVAGSGVGQMLFGGADNDVIIGSSDGELIDPDFSDAIYFGDLIDAGAGNDTVYGLGGADWIFGGIGNDHIESGAGRDQVNAGDGDDWVFVGYDLGEFVLGGDGNDTLIGSDAGDDTLLGEGGNDDLFGQGGEDSLVGGADADVIDGGAGTDRIEGEEGDDELRGGGGDGDQLLGGIGNDLLIGSDDGGDFIQAGDGRDTAMGGGGNDAINGEGDDDVLQGGAGDDVISGGLGSDVITGGADHDTLYGHEPTWVLTPPDDNRVDYLYGDFGTNLDEPGSGRDQLDGSGGNDLLFGEGDDDLIVSAIGDLVDYGSGESANQIDFVVPAITPDPVNVSVGALIAPTATLPDGVTDAGRWGEFAGSASGQGISHAPTGGIEPSVVVSDDGTRYVAWVDLRNGNHEIHVARHTDVGGWISLGGSAASGGVSSTSGESRRPSLSLDESGRPVVAWTERDSAGSDIHVAAFDANSDSWISVGSSSNVTSTGAADEAVLRNSDSGLVLAWIDRRSGVANGFVRRFDGSTWNEIDGSGSATGVTGSTSDVEGFRLTTTTGKLAVSWTQTVGEQTQIFLKENAGVGWNEIAGSASGEGASESITSAFDSSLAYQGDLLFVGWTEMDGPSEIPGGQVGVVKFQNGVRSVVTPTSLITNDAATRQARLASGGGALFLSWTTQPLSPSTDTPIYVTRFDGTAFVEELPGEASGRGVHPDAIAPSGLELRVSDSGHPHLVWQDGSDSRASQVFLRGERTDVDLANRLFVADGSPGKSVSELLAANDFGPGDVILVQGNSDEYVTVGPDDSGVMILGGLDATLASLTINASNVTVQRVSVGSVNIEAASATIRESGVGNLLIGGSDATLVHNRLGSLTLAAGANGTVVADNELTQVALDGAADVVVRNNRISHPEGTAIDVVNASSGYIADNDVFGSEVGIAFNAAFSGSFFHNQIRDHATGVQYDAAAPLSGNRIYGNQTGVIATVVELADAFGFVGETDPNEIFANEIGVELTGRMQGQTIDGNTIGVIGEGVLGGDDFTAPNRIEANDIGVDFDGEVRYNRIGYNRVGVVAKPSQLIAHNLLYRNDDVAIHVDAADDVRIIGNTAYSPDGDNVRITGESRRAEVWNNVLWAESGYNLFVDLDSRNGFFSDYNVLHASDEGKLIHYVIDFTDLLDWQVDLDEFDLHSVGTTIVNPHGAEPRFVNRWRDDYTISDPIGGQRFTSPTIAAGNPVMDAGRSATHADANAFLGGHGTVNLLANGNFENGLVDWVTNPGSTTRDSGPVAYTGEHYFAGGAVAVGEALQTIDLVASGYSESDIDLGDLRVQFGARIRSANESVPDEGRIELELLGADGTVISSLEVLSSNTTDRWELVGGHSVVPAGTRSIRFIFTATRNSGTGNDAWMDGAFLRVAHLAYGVDAGVGVISPVEQSTNESPHLALRYPDLYTDWEQNKPKVIRWDSYNNQTDVPVRIDLYQEGAEGPSFVTTIVAATPDDGQFSWTPADSGISAGTHDLLIHISRTANALIFDRSTETFTVPEATTTFYVNDAVQADDQYTTVVGATRHSGKTPDEPKRLPVNLLRTYSLGPNDTLHIDDGSYAQLEPIYLSGTIGVGDDEGFVLTGPSIAGSNAEITHLVPGTDAPLVTLDDADFMTIKHLELVDARHGVLAINNSTNASFSDLIVSGHASDGIRMENGSTFSTAERLVANDNGGHGIYTTGVANRISYVTANDNTLSGITIGGAVLAVEDLEVSGNAGDGFASTGSLSTVARVEANDNGDDGLDLSLVTGSVSQIHSMRNAGDGIRASVQAGTEVFDNTASDNVAAGIVLGGSLGIVRDNTIENNGYVGLSTGDSTVIQRNSVSGNSGIGISTGNLSTVGDPDLSLGLGNLVQDNGGNGISSGGSSTVAGNTVSGHSTGSGISVQRSHVTRNVVFGNRDGISAVLRWGGTTIDGNRIYDNSDAAIEVGGGTTVSNNTIYSNARGIAINYEYASAASTTTVRNNLIYDHAGWAIQTATSNDVFENNTIFQTTGGGISIRDSGSTRLRNNILSIDEGVGVDVAPNSLAGLDSDYNLIQSGPSGLVGSWNGTLQGSISDWQTASNEDTNSIAGDPRFVDIDGADDLLGYSTTTNDGRDDDFHLQSTEGRFTGSNAPVVDSATGLPIWLEVTEMTDSAQSSAIDRGDISMAVTNEPAPNGGYVNLGAYGNTSQASKSPDEFLFVSTPNGSEAWAAERTYNISWRASDVGAGSSSVVNIDLIRDSVTDVTPLLTAGMNVGSYEWTVPVSTLPADDYRIRITRVLGGDEIVDESDAPFAIIAPISFYYVNDTFTPDDQYAQADGNDANDGLSPLTPKASIQSVLESYTLAPGDTILVDDGHYLVETDISLGESTQGVTFQGPTDTGSSALLDRNGGNALFVFTDADDVTIRNLSLTNAGHGIAAWGGDSDRIQILENDIFANRITGIELNQTAAEQWLIANNRIYATTPTSGASGRVGSGIYAINGVAEVRNNQVFGNVSNGIVLNGASSVARENITHDNGSAGLSISASGNAINNVSYNNATGIYSATRWGGPDIDLIGNTVFGNGDGINMYAGTTSSQINAIGNKVFSNNRGIIAQKYDIHWAYYSGTIRGNLIYDNTNASLLISRSGSGVEVSNNTIVADGHAAVRVSSGSGIPFYNNLYSVTAGAVYNWSDTSLSDKTSNFNQFDLGAGAWIATLPASTVPNLTEWILDQRQDANSVSGDAQFVDADGPDDVLGISQTPIGDPIVMDHQDPGFSTTGEWIPGTTQYVESEEFLYATGTQNVARWTFDGLVAGAHYHVSTASPGRYIVNRTGYPFTTGAIFSVISDDQLVGANVVRQWSEGLSIQSSPVGIYQAGTDGRLIVELLGSTTSHPAAADSISLQQVAISFGEDDDFHLLPGAPGIDGGDPLYPVGEEPSPNGGRINIGAYGGTNEATVSPAEELTFVLEPNGLNRFSAGGTMPIRWSSTVQGPVDIELYAAAGYQPGVSTPVIAIADDLVASGSFNWQIPADGSVPTDNSYLVVVRNTVGTQSSDVSDAPFFIANSGNAYYVNDDSLNGDQYATATGDDLNLGKSPDQPMRSLAALLRSWTLSPGDVIYVDSGNYSITSDIVLAAQQSGITIAGPTHGGTAILDRLGGDSILTFSGADDVTVKNLHFTNANAAVYATGSDPSDRITIENNEVFSNIGTGILMYQFESTGWDIAENRIFATNGTTGLYPSAAWGYGIYVIGVANTVRDNLVSGNKNGISLSGINSPATRNVVHSNSSTGISAGQSADVIDNVIFSNGTGIYSATRNNGTSIDLIGNTVFDNGDGINMYSGSTSAQINAIGNRVFGNNRGIIAQQYPIHWAYYSGTIANNLVYDNSNAALVMSKTGAGTVVKNNTIVADGHDAVDLLSGTSVEFRNNLFSVDNGYAYDFAGTSVDSHQSDYNQFDLGAEGKLANLGSATADTYADWVLYHQKDINGQSGSAGFVDPDGANDLRGYALAPIGDPIVMDHQDAAFTSTGEWTAGSTQIGGPEEFIYVAGRENRARWSFTDLVPGEMYEVTTSFPGRYWIGSTGHAFTTAAAFTVKSGTQIAGAKVISQWSESFATISATLGLYQASADGTLTVELEGPSTSAPAVADSVSLQRMDVSFGEDDNFHLLPDAIGIDKGDPADSIAEEPAPNGGRINIGAYGGTAEATKSATDEVLQVLSPNGLNRFSAGNTVPITWRSEIAEPVDIFLYAAEGYQPGVSTPVLQIADELVAPGNYDWVIPDDATIATDQKYLIRIESTIGSDAADESDRPFIIANGGNAYYINDGSLDGDVYATAIGDDSNVGKSPDQPMADLRALLQNYELGQGDVIYIDSGVYSPVFTIQFGEELSGITLQGPVSETSKAIFEGTGSGTAFQLNGGDDISFQNLSITNFANGIYSHNVDSDRIAVRDSEIYANTTYGIYVRDTSAENWLIENNRVYNHSGTNDYGIYGDAGVEIRNNSLFGNFRGAYGNGTNAQIHHNAAFSNNTGLYASNGASAFSNSVYDNSTGVFAYSGFGNAATHIYENEVRANSNGITAEVDNHFGATRQILITDNRIYNNSTGINGRKSSRYSARLTADIESNFIYSNSTGIYIQYAATSAKIQNNLIYGNTNLGVFLTIADQASVLNNTIVQEVGDVIRIEGSTDQLVLKNNILSTQSGNVLSVAEDSLVNQFFDYNLLHQGTDPNAHIGLWGTTVLDSLSQWQTTTGLDANSITGDPGFVDMDGADNILGYVADGGGYDGGRDDNFLLSAGSIAIDRGDTVSAPQLDLLGNVRMDDPGTINGGSDGGFVDLGAYEFQGDSSDSVPPTIIGSMPAAIHTGGGHAGSLTEIVLTLSEAINEIDAWSVAAYGLLYAGTDGVFGNLDDTLISLSPHYEAGSTELMLLIDEPLDFGNFQLTVFGSSTVHDLSGLRLDGDTDGVAGGDYVREFSYVDDLPPVANDQSVVIDEDVETRITLSGDDGDAGVEQDLLFYIASLPEHGTLSRTAGGTTITEEQLPLELVGSDVFFRPHNHAHDASNFTFFTRDDDGSSADPQRVSSVASVSVSITPTNDPPSIADAVVAVGELSPFGITITTMQATDPDLFDANPDSLEFAIVGGNEDNAFQIFPSGRVVLLSTDALDYEVASSRVLTVEVSDAQGASDSASLTINLIDELEAQVEDVQIGDESAQRSAIGTVKVTFNRIVELDLIAGGPFRLTHMSSGDEIELIVEQTIQNDQTIAQIHFLPGTHVDANGNLRDGRYDFRVLHSQVSAEGYALDGNRDGTVGDDFVLDTEGADQFFRLFGDSDGNGVVDGRDVANFGSTFLKSAGEDGFDTRFDFDGDGDVDGRDYLELNKRLLRRI